MPNVTDRVSTADAAVAYARKGFAVFPIKPGSKEPRTPNGYHDATTDAEQVRAWWKQHPNDGIGIAANASGLTVIDVDTPEHLPDELRNILEGSQTAVHASSKDGTRRHYFYEDETPRRQATMRRWGGEWGEVRANGYVIVAPTKHAKSDGRYNWLSHDLAPLPAEIAAELPLEGEAARHEVDRDVYAEFAASYSSGDRLDLAQARADRVRNTSEGRNIALAAEAGPVGREAMAGLYPADEAYKLLVDAALTAGLEAGETRRAIENGIGYALATPDEEIQTIRDNHAPVWLVDPETGEEAPREDSEEEFWSSSPARSIIRQYALATRNNPWAVLGVVLARVACTIAPGYRLNTGVRSPASLNMFVALVGRSGGGKSAAWDAGNEVVQLPRIDTYGVGTGEGLIAAYTEWRAHGRTEEERKQCPHSDLGVACREKGHHVRVGESAMFYEDEIDNLVALKTRDGATLSAAIRKAWLAGQLGNKNRDHNTSGQVDANTYRMSIVLGMQPGRGQGLLDEATGGLPQRFLYMPARKVIVPDRPGTPEPVRLGGPMPLSGGYVRVPDAVRAWYRRLEDTPEEEIDELDSHAGLLRGKVAVLLAALEGRDDLVVTPADWRAAGEVMEVSRHTRAEVLRHLAGQRREAERAQDRRAIETAVEKATAVDKSRLTRAIAQVEDKLTKADGEWVTWGRLTLRLSSDLREELGAALDHLETRGSVELEEGRNEGKPRARLKQC